MATTVAEKIIRIDVIASAQAQKNLQSLADDMRKVETAADQMNKNVKNGFSGVQDLFSNLTRFFGALGISVGIGEAAKAILNMAQAYEILNARLKLVLGSQDQANRASAAVFDIARVTGREVDAVSKLYEKAARAAQQFGISEKQVTEITLGFSQSIRLSGASTQEAYAALVQFGQALASGRLQGDEFRSLMENNSVFMYEFAKAAGVTVAELRKMGTEGKLSAKFLFETMSKEGADGLNMMERLNKMAKDVPLTFQQSFNALVASATQATGRLAELFAIKSSDPQGIFGPWIRGLKGVAETLAELKTKADALGYNFFDRVKDFFTTFNISDIASPGAGMTMRILRKLGIVDEQKNETLTETLNRELTAARKEVETSGKALSDAMKKSTELESRGITPPRVVSAVIEAEFDRLKKAEERVRSIQSTLNSLSYGDRYEAPPPKGKDPIDPEVEKKQKNALEQLKDFIDTQERRTETTKRLALGGAELTDIQKDLVKLEQLLDQAGVKVNGTLAVRAYQLISEREGYERSIEIKKQYDKANQEETAAGTKLIEKIQEQIERDQGAIEALKNKTRATQEYTTAELERNRTLAQSNLDDAVGFSTGDDPAIKRLQAIIDKYDRAIAKRRELEGAQALNRQAELQKKIDKENEDRVSRLAEDINTQLKRNITSGDIGGSLLKNIKDAFRNKVIDIVLNPVTSLISRVLAQLADDFSRLLSRKLFESISNSTSDPLGSFINLSGNGGGGGGIFGTLLDFFGLGSVGSGFSGGTKGSFDAPAVTTASIGGGFESAFGRLALAAAAPVGGGGAASYVIQSSPVFNIDSRTDIGTIQQITAEATAQGNRALVEELRAQGALS